MIDLEFIKLVLAARKLTIHSQEDHLRRVWASLKTQLTDERLDEFSPFIFAWGLLPMWSKMFLLSVTRENHADAFTGITNTTPLEHYNPRQLELLINTCQRVLQTSVTLFSDWEFANEFYPPYREQRKKALGQL